MTQILVQDVSPRVQYVANSAQTTYTFTFPVYAATDINVYSRPAGSTAYDPSNILTYVTQYSVTLNPADNNGGPSPGGSISLVTPSTVGDIVTIVRNQPDQRLNYYVNGGLFAAPTVNSDFGQDVLMIQQNKMYDTVIAPHYNVNANINYPTVDTLLPILPNGYVWMKAVDGSGIVAVPYSGGGGGSGSVTSVGLTSSTLTVSGSPITSSGTITADLPASGVAAGSYTSANITVDTYGRVTVASNGSGAANGSFLSSTINQVAHGFTVGQVVYFNGSVYALALADTAADGEVIGIVEAVANANAFTLLTAGQITTLSGLTAGVYFLSDAVAGALTQTEPTTPGHISKPLLIATSATTGYFYNYRGKVIPTPVVPSGSWQSVLTATQMVSNVNYIVNGGAVAFTLPTTAAVGEIMRIACYTNSWSIVQGAGQQIQLGNTSTTLGAGGSLASTHTGDCIELLCTAANTNWTVLSSMGNITTI